MLVPKTVFFVRHSFVLAAPRIFERLSAARYELKHMHICKKGLVYIRVNLCLTGDLSACL